MNSFLSVSVNPDDFSVVLRARKSILEGEEITISYVPPVYGLPKRKLYLASDWYFDCSCSRCSDVTEFGTFVSALKCSSCSEGLILPEDQREGSGQVRVLHLNTFFRILVEMQVLLQSI